MPAATGKPCGVLVTALTPSAQEPICPPSKGLLRLGRQLAHCNVEQLAQSACAAAAGAVHELLPAACDVPLPPRQHRHAAAARAVAHRFSEVGCIPEALQRGLCPLQLIISLLQQLQSAGQHQAVNSGI